jgi:hypothetical protein
LNVIVTDQGVLLHLDYAGMKLKLGIEYVQIENADITKKAACHRFFCYW